MGMLSDWALHLGSSCHVCVVRVVVVMEGGRKGEGQGV